MQCRCRRNNVPLLIVVATLITFYCQIYCQSAFSDEATIKQVTPLPQAHAHNDYYHKRPLLDALDHGFCSVEADVFLVDGELQVAHGRSELNPERTLTKLYLEPLRQRVELHGGHVYRNGPSFTLMIDIKSSGKETYKAIHTELEKYRTMLTRVEGDNVIAGPVSVIISGNRDQETIAADNPRYVGIDGRLSDLDTDLPAHLMPMISDNWMNHFKWRGIDEFDAIEKDNLLSVVEKAHKAGRRVRFWATPESPAIWTELYSAGADAINTDQLENLETFLRDAAAHDTK